MLCVCTPLTSGLHRLLATRGASSQRGSRRSYGAQAGRPERVLEELRRSSALMSGDSLEEELQIEEPTPARGGHQTLTLLRPGLTPYLEP